MNLLLRLLSRLVEALVVLCAAVIVIIVTIEVVLRYIFGLSLIFTEELSRYLMVWVVFLGSAIAVRDGSHIRINVLVKHLGARTRRLVPLIAHALTVIFLIVVTIEGIKILPRQLYQMAITVDVSLFYFYLAIPVGSVLMIVFLVPQIKEAITGKPQGGWPEDEGRN